MESQLKTTQLKLQYGEFSNNQFKPKIYIYTLEGNGSVLWSRGFNVICKLLGKCLEGAYFPLIDIPVRLKVETASESCHSKFCWVNIRRKLVFKNWSPNCHCSLFATIQNWKDSNISYFKIKLYQLMNVSFSLMLFIVT